MPKRDFKKIYRYNCSITNELFKTTRPAPNPDELISIPAYYEMNPEKDDRPEAIKKEVGEEVRLNEKEKEKELEQESQEKETKESKE